MTRRPRTAVVLSGGGAKAAYQVGVLKALFSGASPATGGRPLDADVFTGTSAGAYNAVQLVSQSAPGADAVRRLENVWLRRIADLPPGPGNGVFRLRAAPLGLFDRPGRRAPMDLLLELGRDAGFWTAEALRRGQMFLGRRGSLQSRLLETLDLSSFFSPEPFHRLVHDTVDLEGLRRAPQNLHVVAADWATGAVRRFTKQDIAHRVGLSPVIASAAIPGVLPPVQIEGRPYVDGSVVMATPLRPAIRDGADELHVVYVDAEVGHLPLPDVSNSVDTISRVFLFTVAGRVNGDIATAAAVNREVQLVDDLARLGLDLSAAGEAVELLSPHSRVLRRLREGRPYRELTLHRYGLRDDRGGGEGVLDFDADYLRHLIDVGYRDAANHDCRTAGCVLPDRLAARHAEAPSPAPRAGEDAAVPAAPPATEPEVN